MNNRSNYFYKYLIRIHSQLYKKKLLRIVKIHDDNLQYKIIWNEKIEQWMLLECNIETYLI